MCACIGQNLLVRLVLDAYLIMPSETIFWNPVTC